MAKVLASYEIDVDLSPKRAAVAAAWGAINLAMIGREDVPFGVEAPELPELAEWHWRVAASRPTRLRVDIMDDGRFVPRLPDQPGDASQLSVALCVPAE